MLLSLLVVLLSCQAFESSDEIYKNVQPRYCREITCLGSLDTNLCPEDSVYTENIAQEGCCSGCVRYLGLFDEGCTGSLSDDDSTVYVKDSIIDRPEKGQEQEESTHVIKSSLCARQLECEDSTHTCIRATDTITSCRIIQKLYDDQVSNPNEDWKTEFRWRPDCTSDGLYKPKQCKGSDSFNFDEKVCLCVDEDGEPIYGKAMQFQTDLYKDMNCLCSREVWTRKQRGESVTTLHCTENGNFEELQCEYGWCYCVQPEDGRPLGMKVPEKSMKVLPCYNRTMMGDTYARRCDSELHAFEKLVSTLASHGYLVTASANVSCSLDGSYAGKQCHHDNSGHKICHCYDKFNEKLSEEYAGENCNCKRDSELIDNLNDRPTCIPNTGEYEEIQKRYLPNATISYCVDSTGIRTGPKIFSKFSSYLNCTEALSCQMGDQNACSFICFMENEECPSEAYFYSNKKNYFNIKNLQ